MSKKVESIKQAVFYSKENPERLAQIIAGVVADVATTVQITGESDILIPTGDTAVTKTYTAKVFSQYGDEMAGQSITYSVTSATGVSINSSTGVLSISKTASAGEITVTATCGGKTDTITVTLEAQVVTTVTVSGDDSIVVPSGDTPNTKTYTATVKNQYGDTMSDQSITWSIPETTGVSIGSSTGVLSVGKTATAESVVVTATCGTKTGTITVTLAVENEG
jgi:hypothetical protein